MSSNTSTHEAEPRAREVAELATDAELRYRAANFVGYCTLNETVAVETVREKEQQTLLSAIEAAREGDAEARMRVSANVQTDRFERRNKYGFTMPVEITADESGELSQYGQTLHQNTENSIRYLTNDKLLERAKGPEARNAFRLQSVYDAGLLKDNLFVTLSLVHGDMDNDEAEHAGFFSHTRSLCMQVATEQDGTIELKSIFIAGRENIDSEAFDLDASIAFAASFGLDYSNADTEQLLDRPMLIPKELAAEGSASLSMAYDQAAYKVTGEHKFYGRAITEERAPTLQDYIDKEQSDRESIRRAHSSTEATVQRLLASNVSTPDQATALLARLNDEELKEDIVYDDTIDARVLGVDVMWHVYHARHLLQQQNEIYLQDVNMLKSHIRSVGVSSSCPGGSKTDVDALESLNADLADNEEATSTPEDCEFISKECPKCHKKDVKTECRDGVYYGECGCSSKT